MTVDEELFCDVVQTALSGAPNGLVLRMAKLAAQPMERKALDNFDRHRHIGGNAFLLGATIATIWARILVEAAKERTK